MSGELVAMARAGITLLPDEARRVAAAYDALQAEVIDLRREVARLRLFHPRPHHAPETTHPLGPAD